MTARVCHLLISLNPGGLEQLVVQWTNARNAAHPGSTKICTLDENGLLASQVHGDVVTVLHANRAQQPWDLAAVKRLRSVFADVDVVHSHNLAAQQYAALACRGTSVRHIHTEHGSNPHTGGWLNRLRLRFLARRTDALVCVSHDTAAAMRPNWKVADGVVTVIANGVSPHQAVLPSERNALRDQLGIPNDAFLIGSIGRLSREKRYDRLIRTLAALQKREPDLNAMLVLVGEGERHDELVLLADSMSVTASVKFCGFRPEARCFLDVFNLFVLCSESEGLPVALLEAMAARCPVAVTDAGDCLRVIDDGRAGIALPDDKGQWPGCIAAVAKEAEAETLARCERASRRIETDYAQAATLRAYESLYDARSPST
ncbi:MAG: glycosyltransferase [Kiritimatiellae bacterium]|nr:glycosyltransferase [Kiritimatiellia bacterium]